MPQSNFIIDLTIGRFAGQAMSLQIQANSTIVYDNVFPDQSKITVEFNCELPARITFDVAGKQPFDTLLDESRNIVEDKFVRVDRMTVDRMPVEPWILESKLIDFCGQKTNYFHSNGRASIHIPNQDSFGFFLDLMSKD
jgi:hypothetical protein